MIDDLEPMAMNVLEKYRSYRAQAEKKASPNPKRIIFYRDGVSEGQFKQVLDYGTLRCMQCCAHFTDVRVSGHAELPQLKGTLIPFSSVASELKISLQRRARRQGCNLRSL